MTSEEDGRITQGTIAQFMRKRTQLVGFEFGYWKHTQYVAEFLDNALDAIESFQWNELDEEDSKIKFSLDQELSLENLSIIQEIKEDEEIQPLNNEAKLTLMQEVGISESKALEESEILSEEKEEQSGEIVDKTQLEVEEEVRRITDDMNEIIKPVANIVDIEPIVIIRLREYEAPSFLTSELSQKNVMNYTFEIFDNGIGMSKADLRKFGKYLASSKSVELKQTRGSQGFGAPSAFSDAQNTTGKPIIGVSKTSDMIYATVSEFFTTSKNEKKYLVHPSEVDSPFLHGTYVKLNYLNVKYIRGYVDTYIKETALMNPHVTLIYIDPYDEEYIYRRLVSSFPKQPKYAKAHPSSTNIGDLQDLLTKSENLTVSAFLQENFVRISPRTAKEIIKIAERDLQDKLNVFILQEGYLTKLEKKSDPIYYLKFEKRVYGKSTKPRDKLIIYQAASEQLKEDYWNLIAKYNTLNKDLEKINEEIKKYNTKIEKSETKKDIKQIEKSITNLMKDIDIANKEKEKIKVKLNQIIQANKNGLVELKKIKNRTDFEDLISEVQLSKRRPTELSTEQFNSLFHAFKSIKYMAPPTDTAIPVGEQVLENTLIKEIGIKVSENIDDFEDPIEKIEKINDEIVDSKRKAIIKENPSASDEILRNISVGNQELITLNSRILANIAIQNDIELTQFKKNNQKLLTDIKESEDTAYQDVFDYFIENYTKDDDFVSAETRSPTSGKGLAYVVEAALAYCNDANKLDTPKRSRDVLSRFVNRTPKLRDSADCAITKAVQSVNWKNYKLDVYDNNLPKGPIKLLINVSGPYVHLMFKSQSKNALADDEDLIKEIKYCLEAIGRRLRVYLNRKHAIHKKEKRASLIEKYIPQFVESVYNIASKGGTKYKKQLNRDDLIDLMKTAIGVKPRISIPKEDIIDIKDKAIVKAEQQEIGEKEIRVEGKEVFSKETEITSAKEIEKEIPVSIKPQKLVKKTPKSKKLEVPIITTEKILTTLSDKDWQPITHLIFKLKIQDMMDARFLQLKMKELVRKELVEENIIKSKKHWKLK
ncbi:MAG: hypothetical protein ACFE8M_06775 [Candidatus Hermodarchaeota archaeon]